jgi:2-desacetyl-2-hydroxyethyl bacteriochlorophyllide A dehydrogenase
MKAVVIKEPEVAVIKEIDIPEPADNEVQIKVMASGICGTDIHILNGEYLGNYPVVPGHEFSGIVTKIGQSVSRFQVGDHVAVEPNIVCNNCFQCLSNRQNFCENWSAIGVTRIGGMAEYTTVPETNVFHIGKMPFQHGALVEPLSCVLHGLGKLSIEQGDKVVILGAGPIGKLLLQTVRLHGASQVTIVDKNRQRADAAKNVGADKVLYAVEELPRDLFDVVIDATGVIDVMNISIDFARPGGKVLLFGVPPRDGILNLKAFPIFEKGLTVLSSFTSLRNTYQAIALLNRGLINVEAVITHRLPIGKFLEGVKLIVEGADGVGKVQILPNENLEA